VPLWTGLGHVDCLVGASVIVAAAAILERSGWQLIAAADISKKHVSAGVINYKVNSSSYFFVRGTAGGVPGVGRDLLRNVLSAQSFIAYAKHGSSGSLKMLELDSDGETVESDKRRRRSLLQVKMSKDGTVEADILERDVSPFCRSSKLVRGFP